MEALTMKRLLPAILALLVALTLAGAVAPAWSAAQGMTMGVRPPGAWDASAIGAARPAGSWGRAIEVPGLGALSKGGGARVGSGGHRSGRQSAGQVVWRLL